jgi:hypothetical protein
MRAPGIWSPDGTGAGLVKTGPQCDITGDREVAVMKRISGRGRSQRGSRLLGLGVLSLGLAGCAAMTQDVDKYYRQMAYNYQEALDKAKLDEVTLQNQEKVLGVTGDQSGYRRAKRQLEKIRSWEEHCAYEKKRFEKAAEWMEGHFGIKKPEFGEEPAPREIPQLNVPPGAGDSSPAR